MSVSTRKLKGTVCGATTAKLCRRRGSPVRRTVRCFPSPRATDSRIFLTMDKGLEYQQNLAGRAIAIIIFRAESNRLTDLLPHLPACITIMRSIRPGQVIRVGG